MDALGPGGNVCHWHWSLTPKGLAQATCWTSDPMRETVVGFTHFVQIFQGMFWWGLIIDPSHVPRRWKSHPQGRALGEPLTAKTFSTLEDQSHATEPEENTAPSGRRTRRAITGLPRDGSSEELREPEDSVSTRGKATLTLLSDPPARGARHATANSRSPKRLGASEETHLFLPSPWHASQANSP